MARRPVALASLRRRFRALFAGAPAAPLPATLGPQLATLVSEPPRAEGWSYEIKLDGYRILSRVDAGGPRLITRGGHDWSDRMPALIDELASTLRTSPTARGPGSSSSAPAGRSS